MHEQTWKDVHIDPRDGKAVITNAPALRMKPEVATVSREDVLLRHLKFTKAHKFDAATTAKVKKLKLDN